VANLAHRVPNNFAPCSPTRRVASGSAVGRLCLDCSSLDKLAAGPPEFGPIEADVLLCDAAQQIGGKLYILGGGWSRVIATGPLVMAIAVYLKVPWHAANRRIPLLIDLRTEDGRAVPDAAGRPVRIEGEFEVGRPPGLRQGTALDSSLAITIPGLPLLPGVYRWELHVGGQLLKSVPFEVLAAPQPPGAQQPPRQP